MKHKTDTEGVCSRCGSTRIVARVWKENVPTYSGGTIEVEYSQVECSNKTCQEAFVKQLQEDTEKKEVLRVKKEQQDALRIANSLKERQKSLQK